jgi:PhnB protein
MAPLLLSTQGRADRPEPDRGRPIYRRAGAVRRPEKFPSTLSDRAVMFRLQGIGAKREISMAQNAQAKPNPDVKPLPQVKGGAIPYLTVDGVTKAVEFYQKAFAAEVAIVQPPDPKGRIMHAHLYINGSSLMMSDAYPEHGHPFKEPAGFHIMLPVQDVDAWYDRAVKAGCTAIMPPADMFWGDRYGQLKDPFGVTWAINGPIKK